MDIPTAQHELSHIYAGAAYILRETGSLKGVTVHIADTPMVFFEMETSKKAIDATHSAAALGPVALLSEPKMRNVLKSCQAAKADCLSESDKQAARAFKHSLTDEQKTILTVYFYQISTKAASAFCQLARTKSAKRNGVKLDALIDAKRMQSAIDKADNELFNLEFNKMFGTPIGSTEEGQEFTRAILNNELELDVGLARQDNVDAALHLVNENPDLGAIILECTNMVPYAADIRNATGLPIFDITSFVSWFQMGLDPQSY